MIYRPIHQHTHIQSTHPYIIFECFSMSLSNVLRVVSDVSFMIFMIVTRQKHDSSINTPTHTHTINTSIYHKRHAPPDFSLYHFFRVFFDVSFRCLLSMSPCIFHHFPNNFFRCLFPMSFEYFPINSYYSYNK